MARQEVIDLENIQNNAIILSAARFVFYSQNYERLKKENAGLKKIIEALSVGYYEQLNIELQLSQKCNRLITRLERQQAINRELMGKIGKLQLKASK